MITINVCVHEKYAHTKVRIARINTLDYVEFGLLGNEAPSKVFACKSVDELRAMCEEYRSTDVQTAKQEREDFPGFKAWLEIRICFYDDSLERFFVPKADYVSVKAGRNNIQRAFENEALKRGMITNILNVVQARDADKLISILNTLKSAFV